MQTTTRPTIAQASLLSFVASCGDGGFFASPEAMGSYLITQRSLSECVAAGFLAVGEDRIHTLTEAGRAALEGA